jgi:beta-galactosidase
MSAPQDFGGLGVAIPDPFQRYRVLKMKEMGANAWRTAHNPPNRALLQQCDELGVLVWNENHRNRAGGEWLDDLRTLILRDRNRPSVVIWSLCNEVGRSPGPGWWWRWWCGG